ncbi:hypothetical protein BDZ85DRAFT_120276 [Elsinoe ampelina]|uniref:2EXR domain-containing protein n=1 Tax=Elsinoe ampelina TaxID=302913 RepID=A0A6A6GBB1_9PEZI|nr:hypothetical protein BDZ85DRAFT_120276 [Elsinoe ampelina]
MASFNDLPAEIRHQIWHYCLPNISIPHLYNYREHHWLPRPLKSSDPEHEPSSDTESQSEDIEDESAQPLVESGEVYVAVRDVCSETRHLVQEWAVLHQLECCEERVEALPVYKRAFREHDATYVSEDQWNSFLSEPHDRGFDPHNFQGDIGLYGDATDLAIDYGLVLYAPGLTLPELSANRQHWAPSKLILILNPYDVDPTGHEKLTLVDEVGPWSWREGQTDFDYPAKCLPLAEDGQSEPPNRTVTPGDAWRLSVISELHEVLSDYCDVLLPFLVPPMTRFEIWLGSVYPIRD